MLAKSCPSSSPVLDEACARVAHPCGNCRSIRCRSLRRSSLGDGDGRCERDVARRARRGYAPCAMGIRTLFLRGLVATVLVVAVAACNNGKAPSSAGQPADSPQARAAQADPETARLNEWLDGRFEEELAFSPIRKTKLGRKDDYDQIDDASEAAEDKQLAWRRATVEELRRTFDYARLPPEAKTSYDLWVYKLEQAERVAPFRRRFYTFHQMDGPQTDLPKTL